MMSARTQTRKTSRKKPPSVDMKTDRRWHIGIDPGVNTGVAVWDRERRNYVRIETLTFWEALDFVDKFFLPDECVLAVEDPRGNVPVFPKLVAKLKSGNPSAELQVFATMAQRVGRNKREAELLIDGLRRLGYHVNAFTPKKSKWTNEEFREKTGWTGPASEHARDAARAVHEL